MTLVVDSRETPAFGICLSADEGEDVPKGRCALVTPDCTCMEFTALSNSSAVVKSRIERCFEVDTGLASGNTVELSWQLEAMYWPQLPQYAEQVAMREFLALFGTRSGEEYVNFVNTVVVPRFCRQSVSTTSRKRSFLLYVYDTAK